MLLLIAAIGTTWMACDEGRQAFTPPRGPFSLHPLVALVLGFVSGPPAGPLRDFVQMARKQQAEQWAEYRRRVCVSRLLHRQRPLPQSSSASRFTAGAAGFFILSQSGERPER